MLGSQTGDLLDRRVPWHEDDMVGRLVTTPVQLDIQHPKLGEEVNGLGTLAFASSKTSNSWSWYSTFEYLSGWWHMSYRGDASWQPAYSLESRGSTRTAASVKVGSWDLAIV